MGRICSAWNSGVFVRARACLVVDGGPGLSLPRIGQSLKISSTLIGQSLLHPPHLLLGGLDETLPDCKFCSINAKFCRILLHNLNHKIFLSYSLFHLTWIKTWIVSSKSSTSHSMDLREFFSSVAVHSCSSGVLYVEKFYNRIISKIQQITWTRNHLRLVSIFHKVLWSWSEL